VRIRLLVVLAALSACASQRRDSSSPTPLASSRCIEVTVVPDAPVPTRRERDPARYELTNTPSPSAWAGQGALRAVGVPDEGPVEGWIQKFWRLDGDTLEIVSRTHLFGTVYRLAQSPDTMRGRARFFGDVEGAARESQAWAVRIPCSAVARPNGGW